jgi:epoxyqueuosine reductase
MSLKDDLKAEAESLGFSLTGFSAPIRPPHYDHYAKWLSEGKQAAMHYLETDRARERRENPDLILPRVQSILVVGLCYPSPNALPPPPEDEPRGQVASYAWGQDYHDVLPPRLETLAQKIEHLTGRYPDHVSYTDTGPILERDFAQQAGLGWAGKNTCLIAPRQGSYFLLGEMLMDEAVEPDPPFQPDLCGTCTRCIDNCPTNCIQPDRTLDATRCISYLTIENKGAIPEQLRPQVGNWVFGCDICQTVCPWNVRFAAPGGDPAFEPRQEIAQPVLRKELHLTPHDFNRKFAGSPVQRARRRGYLRNIAVAIGNLKDQEAVPDLLWLLDIEPEPLIRTHAAWALGQMTTPVARAGLERALTNENNPEVILAIRVALDL